MSSVTDIVNYALRLVGAERITSLTDGSKGANVANDIYEHLRDDMLRGHAWNFATKRQKLAQSATAPAFEFDHAYPVPSDWLRTISVHDNDAGHGTLIYRMEQVDSQRAIVASSDAIYLRYVAQITDPNKMTTGFFMALAYALGREMAIPMAESKSLRAELAKEAKSQLIHAKSVDALGGFPESRPRGSWAASRGGWRSRTDLND